MNRTDLLDFLTRKNVAGYYELYKKSQWFSKSEMELLQLKKFKDLVSHCFSNVPYYRDYMLEHNMRPGSISSLEDVKLFPIITKEIIKDNYTDFIPLNIKQIKNVRFGRTGGTTGNILIKRTDANTRSSTWAAYKRYEDWMGLPDDHTTLEMMGGYILGSHIKAKFKESVYDWLSKTTTFDPYDTSEKNLNKIIEILKSKQFNLIRSYTAFLFYFASRLKEQGLKFQTKAVSTTAEPLMNLHRKIFKEVFNAETFDQYGFGEIGGIAFECEKHEGLHLTDERVIIEVNDNNELITTDLDNFAMPYIRYWNADQVVLRDNDCSCGRESNLIKKIMGRTCDYVIGPGNEYLHFGYFFHLIYDTDILSKRKLKKFQIVQETRNQILIRLVSEELDEEEKKQIVSNIQSRLGEIIIDFSYEKDISVSESGKYRAVVNKLL